MNQGSMTPANLMFHHGIPEYLSDGRVWQGIPSVERTENGRLYAVWYSGKHGEEAGNVVIIEVSDDGGQTWTDGWGLLKHDDPMVRCFDAVPWVDPSGRLWLFWAQGVSVPCRIFDGRVGVWAVCTENPDDDEPIFTAPRRIANGIMMCKPTVARDGTWLLPCALWSNNCNPIEHHPELDDERMANVYASTDEGKTFARRGGVIVPDRGFDEHMIVEKEDGTLWMLTRTHYGIGQAFSKDGGYTWENIGPSGHTGPNSRFFIRRLQSGRLLMVNHVNPSYQTSPQKWNRRNNLMAMLSDDDGLTWRGGLMLDARNDVSYPDGVEGPDGRICIIYDHERYGAREILMSVFTEEDVLMGRPVSGKAQFEVLVSRATGKKEL